MRWLIYGSHGWIGRQLLNYFARDEDEIIHGQSRLENFRDLKKEVKRVRPDRIISLTGRTRGPGYNSIDYLEQPGKLQENIRDNLLGPMNLAFVSNLHQIHYTYMGTGCIFSGYPLEGFCEDDEPNFFGSSYSTVKGATDMLITNFPNVLNIRIRMPINDDLTDSNNFITKIMSFPKICSKYNSMSYLPDLLPILIDLSRQKITGTFNLVNPGLINHNQILTRLKRKLYPQLQWINITVEQQREMLLSDRSNNHLNTDLISRYYPDVLNIQKTIENLISRLEEKKFAEDQGQNQEQDISDGNHSDENSSETESSLPLFSSLSHSETESSSEFSSEHLDESSQIHDSVDPLENLIIQLEILDTDPH